MSLDEAASRARLGWAPRCTSRCCATAGWRRCWRSTSPIRRRSAKIRAAWRRKPPSWPGPRSHARAELALRTSSAQLAAMFDQASAGIAVCDRNWRFTRVNDRYCEIAGRSRETLLGLRMQDILDPADFALPAAPGGATGAAFEMSGRYVRPDGDTVGAEPGHAAGGRAACRQRPALRMDISARVRAENEPARTQRKPGRTCRDHARPARKRPGAASRGTQDGDGRPVDRRHRP